jgi:ribonuclease HI
MTDIHALRKETLRLSLCNRARNPVKGCEQWLSGYSDASFLPSTGHGGWGAWVRDDRTRVLVSGPTPQWVYGASGAELCGVFNAVKNALEHLDAEKANIMVIKTDNQTVARFFGWNGGSIPTLTSVKGKDQTEFIKMVHDTYDLCETHRVKLVVTWVKGHNGTRDIKSYLNTQVDRMAGIASRTQKGEFFKQPVTKG